MRIGELSRLSGVSARMLRHYDSTGLVRPSERTAAGYREYSAADALRLFHVESLRSLGLSLHETGRVLDEPGFDPSALVGELIAAAEDRIATEEELLGRLRQVRAAGPGEWSDVFRLIALIRGLDSDNASQRQRAALTSGSERRAPASVLAEALAGETDVNVAGALRWALARSGDGWTEAISDALYEKAPEVRRRAVDLVVALDTPAATELLALALDDPDQLVRARASVALGARGDLRAVEALFDAVMNGVHDVEAAEALGSLAREHGREDRIAADIFERLQDPSADPSARLRLTQALAELPGSIADQVLDTLTRDSQRPLALTATYILRSREDRAP